MKKGLGINSIIFLAFGLFTLIAWIGFEVYHKSNDLEIPANISQEANTTLPPSFDSETLKSLYQGKDKFYEYNKTNEEQR